jgi:hypothetical protein
MENAVMRITKKWLRGQKKGMQHRVMELCAMGQHGKLADEYFRCFPAAVGNTAIDHGDWRKMRELLSDLIELSFPTHVVD